MFGDTVLSQRIVWEGVWPTSPREGKHNSMQQSFSYRASTSPAAMPTLKYKWIPRADADADNASGAQEHVGGATWSAAPAVRPPDPVFPAASADTAASVPNDAAAAAAAARPLAYDVPVPPRSVVPPTFTAHTMGPYYYYPHHQQQQQQQPVTLLRR